MIFRAWEMNALCSAQPSLVLLCYALLLPAALCHAMPGPSGLICYQITIKLKTLQAQIVEILSFWFVLNIFLLSK